jgi:hypothetical protein
MWLKSLISRLSNLSGALLERRFSYCPHAALAACLRACRSLRASGKPRTYRHCLDRCTQHEIDMMLFILASILRRGCEPGVTCAGRVFRFCKQPLEVRENIRDERSAAGVCANRIRR